MDPLLGSRIQKHPRGLYRYRWCWCGGILLRAPLSYRQRAELEDLRRQLEENSSLAGRALREELDKTREEQERRHQVMSEQNRLSARPRSGLLTECGLCNQVEMKSLQERLDIEKKTWEENHKKKEVSRHFFLSLCCVCSSQSSVLCVLSWHPTLILFCRQVSPV